MRACREIRNVANGALRSVERSDRVGAAEIALGIVFDSIVSHIDAAILRGCDKIRKVGARERLIGAGIDRADIRVRKRGGCTQPSRGGTITGRKKRGYDVAVSLKHTSRA